MTSRSLYLSPHLDDAVLSCGGLICRQVHEGTRVLVVTIFAGTPPHAVLSPFAAEMHARWRITADPVAVRREEDRRAMEVLRADYVHLEYPDAIYRSEVDSFRYVSDEDLFGSLHPSDAALVPSVAASIAGTCSLQDTMIYAPLAVGNHVDHQLGRDVVLTLDVSPSQVVFYEDFPYAEDPGKVTKAVETLGAGMLEPLPQQFDEVCLGAKTRAISAYRSQMATLFGTNVEMAIQVRDHARAFAPGQRFGERFWRMKAGEAHREGSVPRPV